MKVSVVIPVYNVEKYLSDCLDSILRQTLADFELILIDDGSADSSFAIMQQYALSDVRIRIVSQTNRGVSAARNHGLSLAQGDYVLFVDSDDTILPNTLEYLWNHAQKTDADIVLGNLWKYNLNGSRSRMFSRSQWVEQQVLIRGDLLYEALMSTFSFPTMVYLYFSKRSFLLDNNIWMKEGILHEDELWCMLVMCTSQKVAPLDFFYYLYTEREGSIMNSDNLYYRVESLFVVAKEMILFMNVHKDRLRPETLGWMYVRIFWLYLQIANLVKQLSISGLEYFLYYRILLKQIFVFLGGRQQELCLDFYRRATILLSLKEG